MADDAFLLAGETTVIEDIEAANSLEMGALAEFDASGGVIAHATEGAPAMPAFVAPQSVTGLTLEDSYAPGEHVRLEIPARGSRVQVRVAAGETLDPGVALVSEGSGALTAYDEASHDGGGVIAFADEGGIDTSGETWATLQAVIIA